MLWIDYNISSWLDALADDKPFWSVVALFCARWLLVLSIGAAILFVLVVLRFAPPAGLFGGYLLAAVGGSYLFTLLLAYLIRRKRPYEVTPDAEHMSQMIYTPSFPSGHATMAFALATTLVLLFSPVIWVAVILYAIASIISLARVVVGVHYVTDVLAGAIVGVVGSFAFMNLFLLAIAR